MRVLSAFIFFFLLSIPSSFAGGIYQEDFSTDPGFTSLNSSYAYWDSSAGNYYVRTRDNLSYKYWAYKNIPNVPASSETIQLRMDVMFEYQDWGTYPGVRFYSNEPTDISDQNNPATLVVYNLYSDYVYKKICIRDGSGNSYLTPTISDDTWYTVSIATKAGSKADIKVERKDTGQMIAGWTDIDLVLEDFSYLGVGYYDTPNYGDSWSPIRIDNIEIASGGTTSSPTNLMPILSLLLDGSQAGESFSWRTDTYGDIEGNTDSYSHVVAGFLARLLHHANNLLEDSSENEAAIKELIPNGNFYSFYAQLTRTAFFTGIFPDVANIQYHVATQYDINSGRDIIIIMFQGSREVSDWIHDATFPATEFLNTRVDCHYGIYGMLDFFVSNPYKDTSLLFKSSQSGGLVTLEEYFEQVFNGDDAPIVILVGHSLGGALASMFGAYLVENGLSPNMLSVYTYGAPPIGRANFVARYQSINQFDIKNTKDIVPYSTIFCGDYESMGESHEFIGTLGVNTFNNLPEGTFDCAGFVGANILDMIFDAYGLGGIDFASHSLCSSYIRDYYPNFYISDLCEE